MPRARAASFPALALAAAVLAAGCGGAAARHVGLDAGQERVLAARLTAARSAATRHDTSATATALARFAADVRRLRGEGALTQREAGALLAGARHARARVAIDVPATQAATTAPQATPASPSAPAPQATPTTPTTPPPAPHAAPAPKRAHAPRAPARAHGKGHAKDKGKGEGDD